MLFIKLCGVWQMRICKQTIVFLLRYAINAPATQAVRKQAIDPAMYARKAMRAKSWRLDGANVEKPEICMPIEMGLLKPQRA